MFSKVTTQIRFNNLTKRKYPHCTKIYWSRKAFVDEVLVWAEATGISGIYLMESLHGSGGKIYEKTDLSCAFAFISEEDLGMFGLVFYDKMTKAQEETSIYKLWMVVSDLQARTNKKLSIF